jgi:hypothetical protein
MGFQPFFRKPQLHRPYAQAHNQGMGRHERATNFFRDWWQTRTQPGRVSANTPAENPAPAEPALHRVGTIVSGLVVFLSVLILLLLVMVR